MVKNLTELDQYRVRSKEILQWYGSFGDENGGCFAIEIKKREKKTRLHIIASRGDGWDHVSVSVHNRTPTWEEMEHVKRLFFEEHELAIEYHLPPSDHINLHPNCLHIWRPHNDTIPLPPTYMV